MAIGLSADAPVLRRGPSWWPPAMTGHFIMACVILRPGADCDEDGLRRFCEAALGRYKTPRIIRFVADLPRGPSGKVQRLKLLELLPAG